MRLARRLRTLGSNANGVAAAAWSHNANGVAAAVWGGNNANDVVVVAVSPSIDDPQARKHKLCPSV